MKMAFNESTDEIFGAVSNQEVDDLFEQQRTHESTHQDSDKNGEIISEPVSPNTSQVNHETTRMMSHHDLSINSECISEDETLLASEHIEQSSQIIGSDDAISCMYWKFSQRYDDIIACQNPQVIFIIYF